VDQLLFQIAEIGKKLISALFINYTCQSFPSPHEILFQFLSTILKSFEKLPLFHYTILLKYNLNPFKVIFTVLLHCSPSNSKELERQGNYKRKIQKN